MSLKRRPPAGNVRRVAAIGNNLRGTITNKVGRIVQFESFAERSLLLRLERDRSVRDYASQPETFRAENQPRYTPDFIVWRQDGTTEIHEVTRSERRARVSHQTREQLAGAICRERGWVYVVHTEATLPQGSELANLLSLLRYRPAIYEEADILQSAHRVLQEQGGLHLSALAGMLVSEGPHAPHKIAASLCHGLWHGQLETDWQQPILAQGAFAPDAQVWLLRGEVRS